MHCQNVVIALTTRDNDYQAEQSASATEVASRLGVKIKVIYADNNAVNQTQQLVKIIQDKAQRPDAILVEPVGTPMYKVAKAAVTAGIGWGILNREADYIPELRRTAPVPVFAVSPDQEEVGRIQGKQLAAFITEGNILATPEAQQQYRRRSRVIEFCHAWIKSKLGLRQFHLHGLAKVQTEMLWACITYNLQQWIRLRKLQVAPNARLEPLCPIKNPTPNFSTTPDHPHRRKIKASSFSLL